MGGGPKTAGVDDALRLVREQPSLGDDPATPNPGARAGSWVSISVRAASGSR